MNSLKPILIVEDNPRDLELALVAFQRSQLANELVVARDGVEAIEWLFSKGAHSGRNGGDPAVIVLDLKLPRVDGKQVLRLVKEDAQTKHIPIVMLTSSKEEPDLVECYDLGVNAYVVKPVDIHKFFKAIEDLGIFWGVVNQTHPGHPREAAPLKVTEL